MSPSIPEKQRASNFDSLHIDGHRPTSHTFYRHKSQSQYDRQAGVALNHMFACRVILIRSYDSIIISRWEKMINKAVAKKLFGMIIAMSSLFMRGYSVAQPKPETFRQQKSYYLYYRSNRHFHRQHRHRHNTTRRQFHRFQW